MPKEYKAVIFKNRVIVYHKMEASEGRKDVRFLSFPIEDLYITDKECDFALFKYKINRIDKRKSYEG